MDQDVRLGQTTIEKIVMRNPAFRPQPSTLDLRRSTLANCRCLTVAAFLALTGGCQSLLPSPGSTPPAQRWDQVRGDVKLRLAQQQHEAGQFDAAVRTVTESIAHDPTQPQAYVLWAQANLELGKPASAQAALENAKAAGLQSAELTYIQGVVHELRGQVELALECYQSAHQRQPRVVDYLLAQAECLVVLERPEEALQLLDANLDVLDDNGSVATLAAHVAALMGDAEGAVERYQQALILDAGRTQAVAASNQKARRRSGTEARTGRAGSIPLSFDADARLIAGELGSALAATGRCDEAIGLLDPLLQAADQQASNGVVRAALATCHLRIGDTASAKEVIAPYASAHPRDAHAQFLLAKAALGENDTLTALHALRIAEQHGTDAPELWLVRAAINWKRGRLGAAAADLYDVLQNRPDDTEAHCLLAEVLRAQEHADAARTHFQRALEIDADCAWAAAGLKTLEDPSRPAPVNADAKLTSAQGDAAPAPATP